MISTLRVTPEEELAGLDISQHDEEFKLHSVLKNQTKQQEKTKAALSFLKMQLFY
jgi:hypothetical protein